MHKHRAAKGIGIIVLCCVFIIALGGDKQYAAVSDRERLAVEGPCDIGGKFFWELGQRQLGDLFVGQMPLAAARADLPRMPEAVDFDKYVLTI